MAKNKTTKRTLSGGAGPTAVSVSISNIQIMILLLICGILLAWLIYNQIHAAKSHNPPIPTTHVIEILTQATPSLSPLETPPIYPRHKPTYPLKNTLNEYQQVGVLVSQDNAEDKPIILPLFGRKMSRRDRWEYYTASNEYNMWRISVSINNRDCQDEVGCDEIFNGDNVTVPDYGNKVFVAKIYSYNNVRY